MSNQKYRSLATRKETRLCVDILLFGPMVKVSNFFASRTLRRYTGNLVNFSDFKVRRWFGPSALWSSNSPSGGMNVIVRSASNLPSRTQRWKVQSSICAVTGAEQGSRRGRK